MVIRLTVILRATLRRGPGRAPRRISGVKHVSIGFFDGSNDDLKSSSLYNVVLAVELTILDVQEKFLPAGPQSTKTEIKSKCALELRRNHRWNFYRNFR